jgi:hypothetical protein
MVLGQQLKLLTLLYILLLSSTIFAQEQKVLEAPDIFRRCSPSVAKVLTGRSQGTGFYYEPGILVTAAHVIDGETDIRVEFANGVKTKVALILAFDREADYALLALDHTMPYVPELKVGDYDALQTGETIYIIGNPEGLEFSLTHGIVSAKRKQGTRDILQVSAPAAPGSSGSPVLNKYGRVVAVLSSGIKGADSLNFAVSSDYFKKRLGFSPTDFFKGPQGSKAYSLDKYNEHLNAIKASLKNLEIAYKGLVNAHEAAGYKDQGLSDKQDEVSLFLNSIHRDYNYSNAVNEMREYVDSIKGQITQLDLIELYDLAIDGYSNTYESLEGVKKRKPQYAKDYDKLYELIYSRTEDFAFNLKFIWILLSRESKEESTVYGKALSRNISRFRRSKEKNRRSNIAGSTKPTSGSPFSNVVFKVLR